MKNQLFSCLVTNVQQTPVAVLKPARGRTGAALIAASAKSCFHVMT